MSIAVCNYQGCAWPGYAMAECREFPDCLTIPLSVNIFEYDQRFAAYGTDFVHYDFNAVDSCSDYLLGHHKCYDLIIADPPFLSEECMSKMSKIIINLQRSSASKLVFCSGEVVEPWLVASLPLHKCNFRPEHERNLGNEFVCFANFNFDHYIENNK